jgi:hypothetical protein
MHACVRECGFEIGVKCWDVSTDRVAIIGVEQNWVKTDVYLNVRFFCHFSLIADIEFTM